jgi:hypothetical protein|tara:strand:- start:100 stop:531 length:432 start_codon:yes stop_codon:yes gene_type:complete
VIFVPTEAHHVKYMPKDAVPRYCEDTRGITALDSEKGPVGICLMDSWTDNSVQIHIWIANPLILKHGFAEEVFGFIFGSGRNVVIGSTPSDNPKALKFIKHMGLKEVARLPDVYGDGVDAVLTVMKKDDCRWIEHGQQKIRRA